MYEEAHAGRKWEQNHALDAVHMLMWDATGVGTGKTTADTSTSSRANTVGSGDGAGRTGGDATWTVAAGGARPDGDRKGSCGVRSKRRADGSATSSEQGRRQCGRNSTQGNRRTEHGRRDMGTDGSRADINTRTDGRRDGMDNEARCGRHAHVRYREVQQVRTDATHTQRQRAAPAHHHVTVASDGEIVHVHKSSQMSTDTAGVHETTDSSGCMNEGDKGVEEITEAEYMRGVKRKRDPG